MPTVKYIGRSTFLSGKRLFDILCRLKGFGVGRIVYRNVFYERYPEPSYYVITKVDPDMSDPTEAEIDMRKGGKSLAYGMKYWRGEPQGEQPIYGSYKNDWRIVPKLDEAKFLDYKIMERPMTVLPEKIPVPPLYAFIESERRRWEAGSKDINADVPMMPFKLHPDSRVLFESEAKLLSEVESS